MLPVGSAGDVYPFIGLSKELQARGHDVLFCANDYFAETLGRADIPWVATSTADEFLRIANDPRVWHPFHGPRTVCRYAGNYVESMYHFIRQHTHGPNDLLVTSCLGWGARVAQDRDGYPLVTVDLQPSVLWSKHQPPVLPGLLQGRWVPAWFTQLQFRVGERFFLDPLGCPPVNAFRRRIDLPPIGHLLDWWHSPDCILGLFPTWYAPPQPDWPAQLRLTEFPLWDDGTTERLPDDVETFLQAGAPPIVIAPGSANRFAREFFEVAVTACHQAGFRSMLMSRFRQHLPDELPPTAVHIEYASFAQLLPRSHAIIHHGGVGSTARALASGIPQIIHPLSHDQFDNAARVSRLGCGQRASRRDWRPAALARLLARTAASRPVQEACRAVASRFGGVDPFAASCDVMEQYMASRSSQVAV